jgi:uncharacterized protein (DUF362 family)
LETAEATVIVGSIPSYDANRIDSFLPDSVFASIRPADVVVLKPNWVFEGHKHRSDDWEHVITHPAVITAVLKRVLERLRESGKIIIADGPTTEASFQRILARYPVKTWRRLANARGVPLDIIDLRDHEWVTSSGIVVERRNLPGDPKGSTEVNLLGKTSEFHGHLKSRRGYHGADYDRSETNEAHEGVNNRYRVSRSIIDSDVFINLPKLKTHRKGGITCCLKNLVGINTYKNFLPHHSEGGPAEGGDQYPVDNASARIEGPLMALLKQNVLSKLALARILHPLNPLGKKLFGDTNQVVRSGNWYGNDTIWRMILDLNKILLYANPDGIMRVDQPVSRKKYIGIVDAILAGEGDGPLAPDPVSMGYVLCGTNPVAIDAACAAFMGFDPLKIPSIKNAFDIRHYPLCDFGLDDIRVEFGKEEYALGGVPNSLIFPFEPHFGWKGHIEKVNENC